MADLLPRGMFNNNLMSDQLIGTLRIYFLIFLLRLTSFITFSNYSQDDERLATIKSEYSKGAMLTGEVKKELIGILQVCF